MLCSPRLDRNGALIVESRGRRSCDEMLREFPRSVEPGNERIIANCDRFHVLAGPTGAKIMKKRQSNSSIYVESWLPRLTATTRMPGLDHDMSNERYVPMVFIRTNTGMYDDGQIPVDVRRKDGRFQASSRAAVLTGMHVVHGTTFEFLPHPLFVNIPRGIGGAKRRL